MVRGCRWLLETCLLAAGRLGGGRRERKGRGHPRQGDVPVLVRCRTGRPLCSIGAAKPPIVLQRRLFSRLVQQGPGERLRLRWRLRTAAPRLRLGAWLGGRLRRDASRWGGTCSSGGGATAAAGCLRWQQGHGPQGPRGSHRRRRRRHCRSSCCNRWCFGCGLIHLRLAALLAVRRLQLWRCMSRRAIGAAYGGRGVSQRRRQRHRCRRHRSNHP